MKHFLRRTWKSCERESLGCEWSQYEHVILSTLRLRIFLIFYHDMLYYSKKIVQCMLLISRQKRTYFAVVKFLDCTSFDILSKEKWFKTVWRQDLYVGLFKTGDVNFSELSFSRLRWYVVHIFDLSFYAFLSLSGGLSLTKWRKRFAFFL